MKMLDGVNTPAPARVRLILVTAIILVAAAGTGRGTGRESDDRDDDERGGRAPYAIGLWGDMPYSTLQATVGVPNLIADMNGAASRVHRP
jgi:hypothetical protein